MSKQKYKHFAWWGGRVEEKIRNRITGFIKTLSLPLRTINECDVII